MKTIKTIATAILIGVSTLAFAAHTTVKNTDPVKVVAMPDFVWGDPSAVDEMAAPVNFSAPEFVWGNPGDATANNTFSAPEFVFGDPSAADFEVTASPLAISAPEFVYGNPGDIEL